MLDRCWPIWLIRGWRSIEPELEEETNLRGAAILLGYDLKPPPAPVPVRQKNYSSLPCAAMCADDWTIGRKKKLQQAQP